MKYSKMSLIVAAVCLIATGCYAQPANAPGDIVTSSLHVHLPAKAQAFPEPLAAGQQPGFKFRGIKGWDWTPEQYLEEIPWLVKFKMNFLMNCYLSMFSSTHSSWINGWWKPLPKVKKAAYAKVIHSCQANGIAFCFCMNPQLASKRPLNPSSLKDIDLLYQHYAWAQSQGVKWFSICVDDVKWTHSPTVVAAENAKMVNMILGRLREKDPDAQMIFCPGPYNGDGTQPEVHAYLQTLAQEMNPDVYVFWTGDSVAPSRITVQAAESYKNAVKHRLFLWDNYPVNDGQPNLNLGPVSGRAPGLVQMIDGYMSNPMETENQINRIPLATCADYAYNPRGYDPARSIGQAILLFAKTPAQRKVLQELIEAYPGFITAGGGTGTNPVREKFKKLVADPDPRAAKQFLAQFEQLSKLFEKEFPDQFGAAKNAVAADLVWMKANS